MLSAGSAEPVRRDGHADRLMRPPGVVLAYPRVDRGLRRGQVRERHRVIQQLPAQAQVEPLDLPGRCRRPRLRQPVGDAVVAADPVEQHLPALAEPVSELLAVIGEHLIRHSELPQGGSEGQADRPACRPDRHGGDHAVAGVVVDPGHDLRLGAVGQERAADDVQLPQCHWLVAFPAQVAVLRPLPRSWLYEAAPDQGPVDGHPRRHRPGPEPAQLVDDADRPPPRMLAADLADRRLTNLENSPVPLLDNRHLHQCQSRPPHQPDARKRRVTEKPITGTCKARTGTAVSSIYRDRTHRLPELPNFT